MMKIVVFTLAFLSSYNATAAVFHGIFTGTVANLTAFGPTPISNGDPFTLSIEVETTSGSPLFVGLDINGVTGTFGNTFVSIVDNESGTQDRFEIVSALDSPLGIFDGQPNSNVSVNFVGGAGVFSGTNLDQPFGTNQFQTLDGSFDVNSASYFGDLVVTSGFYIPGSLPSVPVPAAVWLFGSGLLGLCGIAKRKKS